MVANLMPGFLDAYDELGIAQCTLTDQKKCGSGTVVTQYLQNFRCENRMRTVIERERDQFLIGPNAINNVRGKSFQNSEDKKWLGPKDEQGHSRYGSGKNQNHLSSLGGLARPPASTCLRCRQTMRSQLPETPTRVPCQIA